MIKFYCCHHVVERLCGCIVGQQLVLWCIIDSILKQVFRCCFYCHKTRKVESVPTSSELQAANLGVLQVAIGEAHDTLMNPSPTQSNSYYSTQSVTNVQL